MISPESLVVADAHWAADFGCARAELRPAAPRVQRHAGSLLGYAGVQIFVAGAAPLVSVPSALFDAVAGRAEQLTLTALCDAKSLVPLLAPGNVTRVIGPALLHYADRSCFAPVPAPSTRALTTADAAAFADLAAACQAEDWEPKEFAVDSGVAHGSFSAEGTLMACAGYRIWAERIAHVSVVTRPSARSQGYGTRAVAHAVGQALAVGLLAQYRVLEHNTASRRIAAKLGFQPYGFTVAARLAQA